MPQPEPLQSLQAEAADGSAAASGARLYRLRRRRQSRLIVRDGRRDPRAEGLLGIDAQRQRRWLVAVRPGAGGGRRGNIFLTTGNGSFGGANFGNSLVKLRFNTGQFQVADSFTPCNSNWLNQLDLDFGSSGPLLINSNPATVIAGGKEGVVVCDSAEQPRQACAGRRSAELANAPQVQSFLAFPPVTHGGKTHQGNIHGSPVYWKGPDAGRVYVWGENSQLKAYRYKQGKLLDTANPKLGAFRPPDGMPGGLMASRQWQQGRHGDRLGLVPLDGDANQQRGVQGLLVALDAQDIGRTLWTSEQFAQRDRLGLFSKFSNPIVANSKVFVPTFGNEEQKRTYGGGVPAADVSPAYYVAVYGALPATPLTIVNQDSDDLTLISCDDLAAQYRPLRMRGSGGRFVRLHEGLRRGESGGDLSHGDSSGQRQYAVLFAADRDHRDQDQRHRQRHGHRLLQ